MPTLRYLPTARVHDFRRLCAMMPVHGGLDKDVLGGTPICDTARRVAVQNGPKSCHAPISAWRAIAHMTAAAFAGIGRS